MPAPILVVAAALIVGAGLSFALSNDARTRRTLKRRPLTPIRGLREGEVARVSGRVVAGEERYVDFSIDDGTGRLQVVTSVPRVAVVRDLHTRSGTFDDASEIEEAFLRRHELKSVNMIGLNIAIRYEEGVIEPGEEVTVLGLVRAEIRDGRRVLVIDAPDEGPLLMSDDPRAVHG